MAAALLFHVVAAHGADLETDVDAVLKLQDQSLGLYSAPGGLNELYRWRYSDLTLLRIHDAGKLKAPRQWGVQASDVVMSPAYAATVAWLGRAKRFRSVLQLGGPGVEVFLASREHRPDELRRLLSPLFSAIGEGDRGERTTVSQERPSLAADLERLADLHARAVLTDGEFQAAKARLLEGGP